MYTLYISVNSEQNANLFQFLICWLKGEFTILFFVFWVKGIFIRGGNGEGCTNYVSVHPSTTSNPSKSQESLFTNTKNKADYSPLKLIPAPIVISINKLGLVY